MSCQSHVPTLILTPSTDTFIVALGMQLQQHAYAFVRKRQERMASNHRARRAKICKDLKFKVYNLVHTNPVYRQARTLHVDAQNGPALLAQVHLLTTYQQAVLVHRVVDTHAIDISLSLPHRPTKARSL
jgi:hypothetical protein